MARDPEENLSYRYGTYKIPESYIIDRNGKVVRKYAGLPERDGQAISWMDPELVGFVKSLRSCNASANGIPIPTRRRSRCFSRDNES